MAKRKTTETHPDALIARADDEYLGAIDKPIVYVAGPMRGIEHFNFPAFDQAAEWLRGKRSDLYVVSPADMDRALGFNEEEEDVVVDSAFIADAMRRDLRVVTHCHSLLLLRGWEDSTGANNEAFVARACGAELWEADYVHSKSGEVCGYHLLSEGRGPALTKAADAQIFVESVGWGENLDDPIFESDDSILLEADYLINGPRQASYSHPYDDFSRTAKIWEAILEYSNPGVRIEPEHVGLCMIGVKMARETHQHKRDSLVDIAGYAGTVQMVNERKAELG